MKKILIPLSIVVGLIVLGFSSLQFKETDSLGIASPGVRIQTRTVLDAVEVTSTGAAFGVADASNIGFEVVTWQTTGTVKFGCSMENTAPAFGTAASVTNTWGYVDVIDLQTGSSIDGNVGISFTSTSTVRNVKVVDANFKWCTALLDYMSAGTTTVKILPFN